ncbi:MAG: sugar phosphate nucleotidyltransferase [Polyangia bacterium]
MAPVRKVVIMAGGSGTRLWPHSRRSRPKQFLPLLPPDGEALLAATVRRISRLVPIESIFVVTTAEQVGEVRRCLPALSVDNIVVEPLGRNTAPCIGLAAQTIKRRAAAGQEPIIAVLPADHHIDGEEAFLRTVAQAFAVAERGHVVTVGIRPTAPETGYGYIELGERSDDTEPSEPSPRLAAAFVEKPSRERALAYLAAKSYLWNSGMFFFPAQRILDELRTHLPALAQILDEIGQHPERLPVLYAEAPAISIDYAVMEKLGAARVGRDAAIRVLAGDFGWSDVGSFSAVAALVPADEAGNRVLGHGSEEPVLLRCRDNVVWSSSQQLVAALGVEGLVIAVTDDAILILPQRCAQEVREVVSRLQSGGRSGLL